MRKKYDILLFDLDGTLTDPEEGISNAVKYSLSYFGIEENDMKKLRGFIGPPLIDGYMDICGFSYENALIARDKYRDYYSEKGVLENNIYPGIKDLLEEMKLIGKRMFVATSKPVVYADIILKHFGLFNYFEGVCGAEMSEKQHRKSNVIKKAISIAGESDLKKYLMIGDRKHDLIGANEVGIDSLGVLFGYGTKEELVEYCPKYIAETVSDLERILKEL